MPILQYLHAMAQCAVTSFNAGRQEPLPDEQRMAAGYVPDAIEVNYFFLFFKANIHVNLSVPLIFFINLSY